MDRTDPLAARLELLAMLNNLALAAETYARRAGEQGMADAGSTRHAELAAIHLRLAAADLGGEVRREGMS